MFRNNGYGEKSTFQTAEKAQGSASASCKFQKPQAEKTCFSTGDRKQNYSARKLASNTLSNTSKGKGWCMGCMGLQTNQAKISENVCGSVIALNLQKEL